MVKPQVRQVESEAGVIIVDDSIEEKPYTDENEQICWHYDYSQERQVKGINFLTSLYYSQEVSLPVGFVLLSKTQEYIDPKTQKKKRRSPVTKNEYYRQLVEQALKNWIVFRYVLNDVWYSAAENMKFLFEELHKHFIMPLKSNRKVALSLTDKQNGVYVRLDTITIIHRWRSGNLSRRDRISSVAGQASLHERRWQHRNSRFGD